jgi:myo-inositol-1(or 4)-monophosphatase
MAYVAAGRLDGFWEVKLNPWDISAGALMIEEAGGRVSGLAGTPFDSRSGEVVASNGRIHDAMVEVIRSRSRTN